MPPAAISTDTGAGWQHDDDELVYENFKLDFDAPRATSTSSSTPPTTVFSTASPIWSRRSRRAAFIDRGGGAHGCDANGTATIYDRGGSSSSGHYTDVPNFQRPQTGEDITLAGPGNGLFCEIRVVQAHAERPLRSQRVRDLNVFKLLSTDDGPPGHNITGSRWMFKLLPPRS